MKSIQSATNGVFVRQFDPGTFYENYSGQLIVTDDVLLAVGVYGVYVYAYQGLSISLANNVLYVTSTDQNVYAYAATPTSPTVLTNIARLGNGAFRFSFTNTPGATFTTVTSSDLAIPQTNWPSLGYVTEISPGHYQFTDSQATNDPQRFYRVRSP